MELEIFRAVRTSAPTRPPGNLLEEWRGKKARVDQTILPNPEENGEGGEAEAMTCFNDNCENIVVTMTDASSIHRRFESSDECAIADSKSSFLLAAAAAVLFSYLGE